jgi:hypothetical protein
MADTPKYRDERLPVTAEVGGEGGSYADPTYQIATNRGDVPTTEEQAAPDHLVPPGPDPDEGMKKPVTE